MIWSAALLMRRQGVQATSFSDVIDHSGAPRGSIYHHFPGGKAQLVEEATRYAGEFSTSSLASALQSDDPVQAIRNFAGSWAAALRRSDFTAGCPVVAAALEGERLPGARDAAGQAFADWEDVLARALAPRLADPARAPGIAAMVVASIEGAVVLTRARRSLEPLERVAAELERLLIDALA